VQFCGTSHGEYDITAPATESAKQWDGWGTALKPAHEPIVVARKPLVGTVAENVQTHGTGALNIAGCRVGESAEGRWPANVIHDGSEEVLAAFPEARRSSGGTRKNKDSIGFNSYKKPHETGGYDDSGSAARFFYCARACYGLHASKAGAALASMSMPKAT
jgi:hypothetical protein